MGGIKHLCNHFEELINEDKVGCLFQFDCVSHFAYHHIVDFAHLYKMVSVQAHTKL